MLLLLLACSSPKPLDGALAAEGDPARGEARYQMDCAGCHGASGRGNGRTPGLHAAVATEPDAAILDAILNGRGAMTRVPRVDDQAAADILAYLRATHAPR